MPFRRREIADEPEQIEQPKPSVSKQDALSALRDSMADVLGRDDLTPQEHYPINIAFQALKPFAKTVVASEQ